MVKSLGTSFFFNKLKLIEKHCGEITINKPNLLLKDSINAINTTTKKKK